MTNDYFSKKIYKYYLFFFAFLHLIVNFPLTINASEKINGKNNGTIDTNQTYELSESEISKDLNLDEEFYLIGPGDILDLQLYGAPEFSQSLPVLNDGSVSFPLIGNQKLNNLTLEQATKLLKKQYKDQLLRPELQLNIEFARPIKVSIVGEIERPGIYSLSTDEVSMTKGNPNARAKGFPTLINALQKAGGITQNANLKELVIKRRLPGDNNEYKTTTINLLDIVIEGDQSKNLFLFDGDIIKLKTANKLSEYSTEIARTNISPRTINVSVYGQVNNPGIIEMNANTPLVQSIYLAGGPIDWKANTGNVELIRINKDGSATKKKYRLNLLKGLSDDKNPPLKDQDIVYVRSNTLNKFSTAFNAVADPLKPAITTLTLIKLLE